MRFYLHARMRHEALVEAKRRTWSAVMDGLMDGYRHYVQGRYEHRTVQPVWGQGKKALVWTK